MIGGLHAAPGSAPGPSDSQPLSVPPDLEWEIIVRGEGRTTMTADAIVQAFRAGRVDRDTRAWRDGMEEWMKLEDIWELEVPFSRAGLTLRQTTAPSSRQNAASSGPRQPPAADAPQVEPPALASSEAPAKTQGMPWLGPAAGSAALRPTTEDASSALGPDSSGQSKRDALGTAGSPGGRDSSPSVVVREQLDHLDPQVTAPSLKRRRRHRGAWMALLVLLVLAALTVLSYRTGQPAVLYRTLRAHGWEAPLDGAVQRYWVQPYRRLRQRLTR